MLSDPRLMLSDPQVMDSVARRWTLTECREIFDALDAWADHHGPATRQLYLALYRRLHG